MHLMSGVKVSGQFTNFMISRVSSSGILRSRELNRGSEQQKQTQTQSSTLGDSKLPTPYTFLLPLSFQKMFCGGFLRWANWAIYQKQKPWESMGHSYRVLGIKTEEKRYSLEGKGALEE